MAEKFNIFIEGIPGSGKTTLLNALADHFTGYHAYREGDISPVELAWCAYMSEEEYRRSLSEFADMRSQIESKTKKEGIHFIVPYTKIPTENLHFYEYMGEYEVYGGRRTPSEFRDIIMRRVDDFHGNGNLFECSFFQNIIEELMLYTMDSDDAIVDFYKDLISRIELSGFRLIRIVSPDIKHCIEAIKRERVNENGEEIWFQLMMTYLASSPYGKKHSISSFEDMVNHFKRRIALEDEIMKLLPGNCCWNVESRNYDINDILKDLHSMQ